MSGEAGRVVMTRLQELEDSAERFLEAVTQVAPEERRQVMVRVRHVADVVELGFSRIAYGFAETNEYEDEGSVSPIDWIRHNCRMGAGAAADRINVGRQMANAPRSTKAVADGEIGFAHLSLIARTASMVEDSKSSGPFDETVLLEAARETSVGRLWHLCQHVRHAVDPEGLAAEQANAVEWRRLSLKQGEDGSLAVDGWFDPDGGATIRSALEPLSQLSGPEDDRSRDRRMADALVELSHHGLDAGVLPQRAGQRPHVQVTTSLETLRALVGASAGEMEFTLPISGETVRRLACDGTITRVVLGSESVVIDVGRAKRVVAGTTRRALDARDRQCQWPSCDRPPSWTAAHHLVHWARGGDTNLSNMVLLCHRHHWLAHEGRWQLVRTDDGRLLTIPPRPWLFSQVRAPDETGAA